MYTQLLHSLAPDVISDMVPQFKTIDPSTRYLKVVEAAGRLDPPADAVFKHDSTLRVLATAQDRQETNAGFLAHLFVTHPGLAASECE